MNTNQFVHRHIGVTRNDLQNMLKIVDAQSLDQLVDQIIPQHIRLEKKLDLPKPLTEHELTLHLNTLAAKNQVFTSYLGQGWYDTVCPPVIFRNVFENPVWYTSYTPYQAEVSQGRLEVLAHFQTVISELTAMPVANCSLLDEATAAAEAANMLFVTRSREQVNDGKNQLFVDEKMWQSTKNVLKTRAQGKDIQVVTGDYKQLLHEKTFAAIVQFPNADGEVIDYKEFVKNAHAHGVKVAVAADLLSLALLTPPGEWGADVVFGSCQRFGVPMFFGGPAAAYFAVNEEYKRFIPGRIVGLSVDKNGHPAYRLALQTREQHIKREKATSNICTAQALPAMMSAFYAIYHGYDGLKDIAARTHAMAGRAKTALEKIGCKVLYDNYFDTVKVQLHENLKVENVKKEALKRKINLRYFEDGCVGFSTDETTQIKDVEKLLECFMTSPTPVHLPHFEEFTSEVYVERKFCRNSTFLTQEVFMKYHSETELMRFIKRLEIKDISLTHSMISLGSCTMKLNPAAALLPLNRIEFQHIHPYAPKEQVAGFLELIENLSQYLKNITGLHGISLQPNSGAAGEYAGLSVIRNYLISIGQGQRNVVLLPASAHGTNPASAAQCGFTTVTVKCDQYGNVDVQDFQEKTEQFKEKIAACMITYPSTHGIFEGNIRKLFDITHNAGGQCYMDGANMNAQVGLTNPGIIGADVCHLNLHKTFSSPHGGGGPGVGPICVAKHLIPFLPSHHILDGEGENAVAAAPYGSAGLLPITYAYIRLLGEEGLTYATKIAILNANYLAVRLKKAYGIVYTGENGRVGHELILECRQFKGLAQIDETDIAKRLIDFGYHAPTLSFPVHGTLMVEPTESESKDELDRFVHAMECIRMEIQEVQNETADKNDNVLKNAPHPMYEVADDQWKHNYTRGKAAFPTDWVKNNKFWVNVARIDNAYGDRIFLNPQKNKSEIPDQVRG